MAPDEQQPTAADKLGGNNACIRANLPLLSRGKIVF